MKAAFIVNNTAGRNRTFKIWPQLEPKLREKEPDFAVFFTPFKGAGTEVAGKLQNEGFQRMIVVGGDGTLHEVINGINPKQVTIGIIPTGTGNDFCRSMGIPLDPFAAVDYIFSNQIQAIDLGCVNGRRFINIAGIGFDAEVAKEVNENRVLQYLSGTAAYLIAVFIKLFRYKNVPATVSIDSKKIESNLFLAAVGNANYYGGGMKIVPQAVINDGLFHLCIGQDINFFDAVVILPKIFSGRHTEHPKVSFMSGRSVTLTSEKPLAVHADGEIVSVTPASFNILPSCLRILCP